MSAIFLKIFSRILYCLPQPVFNLLVKVAAFFVGKIVRYRKNVIFHNLHFLFPNKSQNELTKIAYKFYYFITEMTLNSIKSLSEPTEHTLNKVILEKPDEFKKYEQAGQSIIILGGHHYNWEAGTGFANKINYHCVYMYKPPKSKEVDQLLKDSRSKCGGLMTSGRDIFKYLKLGQNAPYCYIFVSDQHTATSAAQIPVTFFDQTIDFISGPERFAKKYNYPVFFGKIKPAPNGLCKAEFTLLCDNPQSAPEGSITQKAATMLEEQIKEQPWFWLLSHKRFKDLIDYKKPCPI